jgi:hypothetical protein
MPPDRVPGPPERGVTSPARRRRIPLRLAKRLRKTPLVEQGVIGLISVGINVKGEGEKSHDVACKGTTKLYPPHPEEPAVA